MSQLSFDEGSAFNSNLSNEFIDYRDNLFTKKESLFFLEKIINETKWSQKSVLMYGKEVMTPRLTAWFGDDITDYSIHNAGARPDSWTTALLQIRERVREISGYVFNGVLLNYYRDGNDSVSWHTDNDGIPGRNSVVASISFGQERSFDIRKKENHQDKYSILLKDGSYLLMKNGFQEMYQHRVAKSKQLMKARLNLTFRMLDNL